MEQPLRRGRRRGRRRAGRPRSSSIVDDARRAACSAPGRPRTRRAGSARRRRGSPLARGRRGCPARGPPGRRPHPAGGDQVLADPAAADAGRASSFCRRTPSGSCTSRPARAARAGRPCAWPRRAVPPAGVGPRPGAPRGRARGLMTASSCSAPASRRARRPRAGTARGRAARRGRQPDPLEEQRRWCRTGSPPVSASVPASSTRPAGQQRAHHAVDVDPADRRDPAAGHRLAVGDDGERLQRGLGQLGLLAVEHERLDHGGVRRAGCRTASRRRPRAARSRGRRSSYSAASAAQRVARPGRGSGRSGRRQRDRSVIGSSATISTASSAPAAPAAGPRRRRRPCGHGDVARAPRCGSTAGSTVGSSGASVTAGPSSCGRRGARRTASLRHRSSNSSLTPNSRSSSAGPADRQLAQGVDLVEGDRTLAVELQQGQEAGDHLERRSASATSARKVDRARVHAAARRTIAACSRTLTGGACRWSSADRRLRPGRQRRGGQGGELLRA